MLKRVETCRRVNLWTDALGSFGMGGYYLNDNESIPSTSQAFSVRLSTHFWERHITVKEMMAVQHAIQK